MMESNKKTQPDDQFTKPTTNLLPEFGFCYKCCESTFCLENV